ncbi:hypothetical protein AEI00_08485 [Campylobacter jejuni]|nr:hypothetical protein AEI00_08485 [Campylobacter jejuni]
MISFIKRLNLKSKKPKINPKGKPISKAKTIEILELKSVVFIAEITLSSALKSKNKACLKPSKI